MKKRKNKLTILYKKNYSVDYLRDLEVVMPYHPIWNPKPKNIKKANSNRKIEYVPITKDFRWISGAEIVKEYERKVALKLTKLEGDKFIEIKKKKL